MAVEFGQKEKPYELFDKAKRRGTWDPADIDFSQDREQWKHAFTEEQKDGIMGTMVGFYEGEESVTRTLVPYLTIVDKLEDASFSTIQEEMYLTTHLYEEAKHTDFFSMYFEEVMGTQETEIDDYEESEYWQNPELKKFVVDDLEDIGERMRDIARTGDQTEMRYILAEGTMHYMGIVESQLAKAGYEIFNEVFGEVSDELGTEVLPGFREAVKHIRIDEGRHMTNGRWLMKKLADENPEIVTEIYEPKIDEYIQRLVEYETEEEGKMDQAYSFDTEEITRRTFNSNLRDTIEYIGEERFEKYDTSIDLQSDNPAATAD